MANDDGTVQNPPWGTSVGLGKNSCAACGKKTNNPSYCSRSCAAKHNNRASPKRRPEGECVDCRAAIPTKHQRCKDCQAKVAAEASQAKIRAEQNIHSLRAISGEIVTLPLPRIYVTERFIYDAAGYGEQRLTHAKPSGLFLSRLLAVVFQRPGYLRQADVQRYASLIHAFGRHELDHGWGADRRRTVVADLPIGRIDVALRDWVESTLRGNGWSLMPTFVLDGARFIEAHVRGRTEHPWGRQPWQIKPMIDGMDEDRSSRLDDARLKRDLTSAFGGILVRLCVPEGCRIKDQTTQAVVAEAGVAYFAIERCHLSSGVYDYVDLEFEENDRPMHDIGEEFMLRGKLWPPAAIKALLQRRRDQRIDERVFPRVELPGRWITAWLAQNLEWTDVPNWIP